ncbi:hypothetical protein LWM68_39380 [Niabella sp. W65]|nr:hypothetical protein [Niabella sp. W65]MCH7368264.1 hypothetical protein [Niabella sp. W65]ULT43873.1 hypothetical protein KRR40_11060 [Niabella sp. I65]
MKTSNKLLILLLVLVFSLPLVLMMSFKAAIKNEHYIVKNSNGYDNVPAGALQPFKFIKIEGSIRNEMLKCNIKYGETNRYKWINYSSEQHGDSSRLISYKGDTLVIHYQPKIETINGQESYWAGAELELVLNREVPVIAEGAVITVNTLNGGYTKALEFDLSKTQN